MSIPHAAGPLMVLRAPLQLALVLATFACADATAPEQFHLRIEPTRTTYAPGDLVEVTIRDAGARGVSYNACASVLEQFDRGGWRAAPSFEDGDFLCDDVLHSLPSGTEATGTAGRLSVDIPGGTYRFRIGVILGPDEVPVPLDERVTAPFLVTRP